MQAYTRSKTRGSQEQNNYISIVNTVLLKLPFFVARRVLLFNNFSRIAPVCRTLNQNTKLNVQQNWIECKQKVKLVISWPSTRVNWMRFHSRIAVVYRVSGIDLSLSLWCDLAVTKHTNEQKIINSQYKVSKKGQQRNVKICDISHTGKSGIGHGVKASIPCTQSKCTSPECSKAGYKYCM